ncbi:MAG: hypothetical protein WBW04_08975 [Nitrolancea sp.]
MGTLSDRRDSVTDAPPALMTGRITNVEIFAPTFFEYLLARSVRPVVPVRHVGMRLARWDSQTDDGLVILCGLAGALTEDLRPGDVVIPEETSFEGGAVRSMNADLVDALRASARILGYAQRHGRLLTASGLVTGADRAVWSNRGFVAADMEAALLPEESRVAVVRVILDAPDRSISSDWTSPARAVVDRQRWHEMHWMVRYAPVFARRAALIASVAAREIVGAPSN